PVPGEKALILDAPQRRADALIVRHARTRHVDPQGGHCALSISPSAPAQAQCPRDYPRGQNRSQKQCQLLVSASDFAHPTYPAALLHLLAHQVEPLERRFVRHHEEVGIAAVRLMAREGPMRDREYVMLRPLES